MSDVVDSRWMVKLPSGRLIFWARGSIAWWLLATLLVLVASFHSRPGSAQSSQIVSGAPGVIGGRVVDAETRRPLGGATVDLEATPDIQRGGAGEAPATRTMVTSREGEYRFNGLPPAVYTIVVSRLGYLSGSLEVDLRGSNSTAVSIGLELSPITLSPLQVTGSAPEPFARMQSPRDVEAGSRVLSERSRQERHLVGDTRELTHQEVIEAITLAETDLFRALQRVPGVNTRDDFTATMWTRGASWDQTRVYFDGLPLYNPTHAGWLFAAINPDAVGAASFHPGHRSARWGEGSAAVLDLRSRPGRSGQLVNANAEISVASARLTVDGETPSGRFNWMAAGRRSYVDLVSGLALRITGDEELHIPYDFSDVVVRGEAEMGLGWEIEGSSILEYDILRGDIPGLLDGNRGRWGNRAVRVTVEGPAGPIRLRATAGGTSFSTLIFEEDQPDFPGRATIPALENGIQHRALSVEVAPARVDGGAGSWTLGMQAIQDSVSYDGPFSLLGALVSGGRRDELTQTPFTYGSALHHTAIWGERRWSPGPRFQATTGLRFEFGDSVHNGGSRRFAPRIAVRVEPGWRTAATASWSRVFQYNQDVSPAAGPIGPQLHLSAIWVLASPARAFPAVRSDLATVGLERSWGDGWSVLVNAFTRDATGLKIPNPAPGLVSVGRDPDAEASNRARGLEITARRLSGRWTASLGYGLGHSEMTLRPRATEAVVYTFPSSADIRHGLDATAITRVGEFLRFGAAFTFGSGVPFTRLIVGDSLNGYRPPRLENPNAERTPSYASLDLLVEYSKVLLDWQVSSYLQIRNATGRRNAVTYSGSRACSEPDGQVILTANTQGCSHGTGPVDRFQPGLPRLPLIGFRIAF